jgi:serine/threonine protein kinase
VPFEIRIADFGFSKYLEDAKSETTATFCGTPLYMSPQIVDGNQHYSYKTDIWSLGVIYYELLTGKHPFTADKMTQLAKNMSAGFY